MLEVLQFFFAKFEAAEIVAPLQYSNSRGRFPMEISSKMSKNWIVQLVLVANILFCSGLRSAAREKKAKCPTCTDIVDAFKKVNSCDLI